MGKGQESQNSNSRVVVISNYHFVLLIRNLQCIFWHASSIKRKKEGVNKRKKEKKGLEVLGFLLR